MEPESIPVIGRAYRLGVNPITTSLVVVGPILLVVIGILGIHPITVVLGTAYVLCVPLSIIYFALAGTLEERGTENE